MKLLSLPCTAQDLIEELKYELTGDLETAVVGLMLTNHQFYANELHDALTGLGTDDKALAEILGSLDRTEIRDIAAVYQKGKRIFELINFFDVLPRTEPSVSVDTIIGIRRRRARWF